MPELQNDMLYLMSLKIAESMLKNGIINQKEYTEIDTILKEKFRPLLVTLLSENT